MKLAEAVAELNPFNDFGQAVPTVEFAPFSLRRHHQLESHGEAGLPAEAPLVRLVRCRTVAKTDSMGFVVRR